MSAQAIPRTRKTKIDRKGKVHVGGYMDESLFNALSEIAKKEFLGNKTVAMNVMLWEGVERRNRRRTRR